jgi:uncharacterized membrane protein YhaH (DUF805 family)
MANMWVDSLKHGLSNLGRFDGRDRPGQFWPYAGTIVFLDIVIWFVAVNVAMSRIQSRMRSPVDSVSSADGTNVFSSLILIMAALALITALILAASVVRRLHDRGISGWWGLLPVPFLIAGLVGMTVFSSLSFSVAKFMIFLMGLNNIAYLVSLVVLIVMLAWTSEPRENRFGPVKAPPA